ncbi:MAG: UvrD-helicase domain-containing protein [Candidatus Falkowbacteria bacterium]|nr:MAG: UvrD-helicase domain-containing protein [Candidatus Falkowbacteria bacterium]
MLEDFKKLNKAQQAAVLHKDGPLLIVAGAGTGKTTVLINRLAHLILNQKISTDEILLLTFTEKAAGEMEERADKIMPYGYVDLWISTFHGFCERILRDHALEIGLNPSFKLLNETDQWVLIKKNLSRFQLDYYRPLGNPTKFISELLKHFSRLKDENISPEEYLRYVEDLESNQDERLSGKKIAKKTKVKAVEADGDDEDGEELEITRLKELADAYHIYNQLLLENNYLDFGGLISYAIKLFVERPNILKYYRQKFQYLMVDEFQDTNLAQYQLVKMLAAPKNNLLVVGDDDQAIYKFRGASISNIMQFKEDYPQAHEIVLTENYRSRQEILDKAYEFINYNNPNRLEVKLNINKKLAAKGGVNKNKKNEPAVQFFNFDTQDEEVSFIGNQIKNIYENKIAQGEEISWLDFAILVRANDTADVYVKELNRLGIPNQFMSWRGLYYKPLVLDILAYFRLLDNYHESSSLFRVLNMEAFKVSHLDLVAINKMAARKVWSLYEALKNINLIAGVSAESVLNIKKLLNLIEKHSLLIANNKPTKIFLHFAYDSGLLEKMDRDRDLELFSYLNQLYQKMKALEDANADLKLKDFLEIINLELEAGETGSLKLDFADNETVKIMTVHGAKGLEFKYVFIVNLVDKKFPTISRSEKISIPDALIKEKVVPSAEAHLEEERRLFYVAATRAKEELYLTSAKDYGLVREKKPSRFILEMGLETETQNQVKLSKRNEFLKDIHLLNGQEPTLIKPKIPEVQYPLPEKFSFSQLAAFATCPLQYKFAFILKIPAASDKASLIFGRVLHNTLYNFLLPILSETKKIQASLFADEKIKPKIEDLINAKRLNVLYQEFWQPDGYQNKEEREAYLQKGRLALNRFFDDYQKNPPAEIIFLEKKFSFKIGADVIKGTMDRVDRLADGSLEIIDYKTGKSKTKLEFKDKRQLILYKIFLEEFLGEKVSQLSYYYLESGEKFSFNATEKEIEKLKSGVLEEIAAIKNRNFAPKPSPMCEFCDFRTICEFRQL